MAWNNSSGSTTDFLKFPILSLRLLPVAPLFSQSSSKHRRTIIADATWASSAWQVIASAKEFSIRSGIFVGSKPILREGYVFSICI